MLPSVKQNLHITDRQYISRYTRQRPTLLELSKRNYNCIRRRPLLARQELLKDKLLSQELAARLAEARLALLGPDVAQEGPEKSAPASKRHSDKRNRRPPRVSFLSVSKRVANIIRFRQAAQGNKSGSGVERENSTLESTENLPKTPRFSSYMSAAAQYALMKGYEDIIFEKLSSKYPESTTTLKRNKTPHHSIAISDQSGFAAKLRNLTAKNWSSLKDDPEDEVSVNSVKSNEKKTESAEESKITSKLEKQHASDLSPECKKGPQHVPGRPGSDDIKNMTENETSESKIHEKSPSSFLPNISKASQTLIRSSHHNLPYLSNYSRPSIVSTENFPEIAGMTSSKSLHRDRRIVLSYRIENAMDILDTIKTKSEQALSPRVKCPSHRHIAPLRDFNRWADQWATEFNSDSVK